MPPVRNAAATRGRLLTSARKRFVEESYENVGLRNIAGDAGVDVALIGRYFGSKEQLFKDVLRSGAADWQELAKEATDLAAFLADLATQQVQFGETSHVERLLIMLRSASSPQASSLVRSSFEEDVLIPLSSLLVGDERNVRAAIALSLLMGNSVMRTIMNLDVHQECEPIAFKNRLEELLRVALS